MSVDLMVNIDCTQISLSTLCNRNITAICLTSRNNIVTMLRDSSLLWTLALMTFFAKIKLDNSLILKE